MTQNPLKYADRLARIDQLIGNTPLIRFDSLSTDRVSIYGKAEWLQLGNSVKARAAFRIISSALSKGMLEDRVLIDASSGNTAIAYASICSRLNIPLEICLPENASQKRKDILTSLGTTLHLTSGLEGTDGAQAVAQEIVSTNPDRYYLANQYGNSANWQAHYHGTAHEIWNQTNGDITHFVTGLGTTGSFVGNAAQLKKYNEGISAIALQPDSPMHPLEGWKHLETAVVPGIYTTENVDRILSVDSGKAMDMISYLAKNEGLLLSPSSAANVQGAVKVAQNLDQGTVVTLLPDDASKYDEVLNLIKS